MTLKDEFIPILKQRIDEENRFLSELPDYWATSPAIRAEIALFTRNLKDTINFLDNDCDGEQLTWLMEVADEISAKLQSWDFIDALYRAADKFPTEDKEYHVKDHIASAIGQLNDSVYEQRYKLENKCKKKKEIIF
jgi:hypothetical protein